MSEINEYPIIYINGCSISFATTTTLNVSSGAVRDQTNNYDIPITAPLTISSASQGLNGLDVGTIGNNKLYNIFIIDSSSGFKPAGAILSLSSVPFLPAGYDLIRLIGLCRTDGSAHFLNMYQVGLESYRSFIFDTPISILTAGAETSFTAINLTGFVPAISNTIITLIASYTPQAAGNEFNLRPTGSTSTVGIQQKGIVAAVEQDSQITMLTLLSAGNPSIDYKVGNAGDALSLSIYSIQLSL